MPSRLARLTAIVFGGGHVGDGPIGYGGSASPARPLLLVRVRTSSWSTATGTPQSASQAITEAGGRSIPVVADMLVEDHAAAAVEVAVGSFGRIDIVQNNIGQTLLGGPLDISLDEWRRVVAINLDTVFLGAKATLPHLLETRVR
jgi:NAD(P)-dependent dehydrogenase (short-subunit alcohol dehydrogenase family)